MAGRHEALEHFYKKFENNNKFHCFAKNDPEACQQLGDYFLKVNKISDAISVFEKNCFENSCGASCYQFCRLNYTGSKVNKPERFIKALEIGSTGKDVDSKCCGLYARVLEQPNDSPLLENMKREKQDIPKAKEMYEKGCAGRDRESCMMAVEFYTKTDHFDIAKALNYAERACDIKSIEGCSFAAYAHEVGHEASGIPVNVEMADYYKQMAVHMSPVKPKSMLYNKKPMLKKPQVNA